MVHRSWLASLSGWSAGCSRSSSLGCRRHLRLVVVRNPQRDRNQEERTRRHHHDGPGGEAFAENLKSEECAEAQKLAHEGYAYEHPAIAQAVGDAVQEGKPGLVSRGEGLGPSHEDAVGDYKAYVGTELLGNGGLVGFEQDVHDDDVKGEDENLDNHAHLAGDEIFEQGKGPGTHGCGEGDAQHHDEGIAEIVGHRQGRAYTEDLDEDGVVRPEPFPEHFAGGTHRLPPISFTAARALATRI
ncbi:hypothetical protein TRIP_E230035 [uncultured Spirochaetota bacterium]|uniref:Uncharacterized protein n=1 Tax=uncultured Spirochaetota bacterium TaxID=460511 RepID=A0A652ZVR6_9SPIR|nr:hypothetical protein TRIP_E230035 [uncultured Spirochaetota bacterium]